MSPENVTSKQPLIRPINRQQMSWRAVDVERLIGEDHPARAIGALVGRMDLGRFYQAIESSAEEGGRPAFDPQLLISLWVYAYSQGIGSAREVARRCEYDPAFQWLTGLDEVNYHTLASFRVEKREELDGLFTQLLVALSQEGLVTLEQAMEELEKLRKLKAARSPNKRVSISDPEARMMKQADGGLALSYNAQISTDAAQGFIVEARVTQAASDWEQLLPAVERIEQRLQQKPQQMVADAGYTTRAAIEEMAERKMDFLGSMPREDASTGKTTPGRLPPSAFVYQAERNRYVCPEGKFLRYEGRHTKQRGLTQYRYQAQKQDCEPGLQKPQCCPGNRKYGRSVMRLEESAVVIAFRRKMLGPEAQIQYRRRGRVVEFCHAWIKCKLGLRQFHVRGLAKAGTELLWTCLTYNLQKWIRLRKLTPATAAG